MKAIEELIATWPLTHFDREVVRNKDWDQAFYPEAGFIFERYQNWENLTFIFYINTLRNVR